LNVLEHVIVYLEAIGWTFSPESPGLAQVIVLISPGRALIQVPIITGSVYEIPKNANIIKQRFKNNKEDENDFKISDIQFFDDRIDKFWNDLRDSARTT